LTPTFAPIADVCLNAPGPVLPTTSTNGIAGTWSPAVSTGTVRTTTYRFTPAGGRCAGPATLTITVTDQLTPTFAPIADVCLNAPGPVLPTTSTNGIAGKIGRASCRDTVGMTAVRLTPAGGKCAGAAGLTVTVT